jgi:hypothetical protein
MDSKAISAGFARLDITPPLGTSVAGYYEDRVGAGVLDPLFATAVAVSREGATAVLVSLDAIGIKRDTVLEYARRAAEGAGLEPEAVLLSCTHTHTGPSVALGNRYEHENPLYNEMLALKICDVAKLAVADLKPAKFHCGRRELEGIAFVRRFRLKDGSFKTWSRPGDPEAVEPAGPPDSQVQLVRAEREGAPDILMVNFQVHPDVIKGNLYSADYPGFVRKTLEKALDNALCVYFNGASGDMNHVNVKREPWDANSGYGYSAHMGRSIAGAALQIYGNMMPLADGPVKFARAAVPAQTNKDSSRVAEAEERISLHRQGRAAELGPRSTTLISEAYRIKELENGPDAFDLPVSAVSFGDVAFAGFPCEYFSSLGRQVKKDSPFAMTFICAQANGYEGYIPDRAGYGQGGYEAASSRFKPGTGELLAEKAISMLREMKYTRERLEIPTAICGRTEETSITDSR